MKVHEYQAKEILRQYGVATPRGTACVSVDEAVAAAEELGGNTWVVKAQIHAGGRGKGGGVKVARSLEEVKAHASAILGMTLVTHQTGPEGKEVKRLLIEEGADIATELYVGAVVDRGSQRVVIMASSEGGTEIEEVAAKTPEKIHKVAVDPDKGLTDAEAEDLARKIGIPDVALACVLTSSRERAIFTPPPLPRPPAWIWALTTQVLPPSSSAAAPASSTEKQAFPRGVATPYCLRISFA